ncbi:phage tail protein [Treponema lecithinolyticum ATCC 700332]|jgi:phage tail protein domain|uniref:Phage tail protein n=2 Tax=Treponema lecithinolyticum TaxID=53418 RepID=A0ABN0P0N5_TRELE|nr:phage tail protein [Treponema lecithinolyticum ATCC 700332]
MGISKKDIYNNNYLYSLCVGLSLYKAKNRLLRMFPFLEEQDIETIFAESDAVRFQVLSCSWKNSKQKKIELTVSSPNPIRHLPSNYQTNDFLQGFLMIFQHIYNQSAGTLDNMHNFFRPMETPLFFLRVLAQWFGIQLDMLGGEDEIRRFLQYAVPLFRLRGTVKGLRTYLTIVSGIVPQIIEGVLPYTSLEISDTAITEVNVFETLQTKDCFTVYFPVERATVSDTLVHRLSVIVQHEKPVHTTCFISFKEPERKKRKITVISSDTVMDAQTGIRV